MQAFYTLTPGLYTQFKRTALMVLAATLTLLVMTGISRSASNSEVATALQGIFAQYKSIEINHIPVPTAQLKVVYEKNGYQPFWIDGSSANARGKAAAEYLLNSEEEEGLYGASYDRSTIGNLLQSQQQNDANSMALVELMLSNAIMQYSYDIRFGTTEPDRILRSGIDRQLVSPVQLFEEASKAGDVVAFMQSQAPLHAEYDAMKKLLKQYRTIAANGGWPSFKKGKTIKPGGNDERVAALRKILIATGDMEAPGPKVVEKKDPKTKQVEYVHEQPDLDSKHYDKDVEKAMVRFQQRHGIDADGSVGTKTQEALAVPVEDRISQIAANMERIRWMPRDLGNKHVLVNVPGFELNGYENGQPTLAMRVIVGQPKNRTPIFSNVVNAVVFNPTWTPPPRIVRNEMMPKLRNNPEYFSGGWTITAHGPDGSYQVDPMSVNPDDLEGVNVSFRQSSGRSNALGKIKFSLPESDAIYMHDTSSPKLFAKTYRSLSHGCIRLEKPDEMAKFILNGNEGWTQEKIEQNYASSKHHTVSVTPIPVHLVYWTTWVDGDGVAHFRDDIYSKDQKLISALIPVKKDDGLKVASR